MKAVEQVRRPGIVAWWSSIVCYTETETEIEIDADDDAEIEIDAGI